MSVIANVEREVVGARRVAETIFITRRSATLRCSGFANMNDDPPLPNCVAIISDCLPHRAGGCLLTVSMERSFMQRHSIEEPRRVSVVMQWEVKFPPTYHTDPCVWRLLRRAPGANEVSLRPFVVEGITPWLETASRPRRTGAERPSDGGLSLASPFIVDIALLCGCWAALELDERCLEPTPRVDAPMTRGAASSAAMGSGPAEDPRGGSCGTRVITRAGRSAVRQPRRAFAAVMAPNGCAIVWGTPRQAHALVDHTSRSSAKLCYTTVTQKAHAQQSLTLVAALPSCVETASTQFETKHRLNDVWLCADDACVALRHNARLCTATHALHGAAGALRLLRRLMRAASPHQPELYAKTVLAPALLRVVVGLQQRRQPFWAGVAVCCIVLPGVLDDRSPLSLAVASSLFDHPECHGCVSLVTSVFAIARLPMKYREAESVRGVMEKLWREKVSSISIPFLTSAIPSQTAPATTVSINQDTATSLHGVGASLLPMAECAVCGLSLLRNDTVEDSDPGLKSTDDCLTVQCARCGHGGHVSHIIGWWEDLSVRCCPKGCDCLCIY